MFKFVIFVAICVGVASAGHLAAESAILSADPLAYSALGSAHLGLSSAPILRSAPLALSGTTLVGSAPALTLVRSPALSLHPAPVISHSSLNIVRSAPLTLSAGW